MNEILEHTNHRINMTMTLLQRIDKHNNSYKHSCIEITGEIIIWFDFFQKFD